MYSSMLAGVVPSRFNRTSSSANCEPRRLSSTRRDLVPNLQIPPHRVRHVEALERACHVRPWLALTFAVHVDDVALLQLGAHALGVPVLDAEADMPDCRRHAVGRRRWRGRWAAARRVATATPAARGASGGIAADDCPRDLADLH